MTPTLLLVAGERTDAWAGEGFPAERLCSPAQVARAFDRASRARSPAVWVADRAAELCPLARHRLRPNATHRVLLLSGASWAEREVLGLAFRCMVSPGQGMRLLPLPELRDALAAPGRAELVVAGFASPNSPLAVLYRGTLEPLVVPVAWLQRRPGVRLDLDALAIADHGQTVVFGEHEVAADHLLFAHDAAYRTHALAREHEHDRSLGGSLRRLRLSHGLRPGDFEGIPDAEIARIERGEATPHRRVLEAIAARLGVRVDELGSY